MRGSRVEVGLVSLVLGTALLGGCGDENDPPDDSAVNESATAAAVCLVADHAGAGELAVAADLFWSEAHDGLHTMASRLQDLDRSAAAALLRAKAAVEAATSAGQRDALPAAAADLERVTLTSLDRLGELPATPCP